MCVQPLRFFAAMIALSGIAQAKLVTLDFEDIPTEELSLSRPDDWLLSSLGVHESYRGVRFGSGNAPSQVSWDPLDSKTAVRNEERRLAGPRNQPDTFDGEQYLLIGQHSLWIDFGTEVDLLGVSLGIIGTPALAAEEVTLTGFDEDFQFVGSSTVAVNGLRIGQVPIIPLQGIRYAEFAGTNRSSVPRYDEFTLDALRFESIAIPEPTLATCWMLGLAWLALRSRRQLSPR